MTNGVAEWFGLKRPNFILDPTRDAEFYAPRSEMDIPKIVEGLQINLVTERPPKRFFWGIYGGGKTHTLFHVTTQLQNLIAICPVYVECPSVPKRSTFHHLYQDGVMASMGQDFVVSLFNELIDTMARKGFARHEVLLVKLKETLGDEELSRAVVSLILPDRKFTFWRYISGVSLSAKDLADLGQTQSLADVIPSKLAEIIICVGKVVKEVRNKTLLLIMDELDRLDNVTDEYGISTYEEALRKLLDENQRDVAVLMGCSARDLMHLPELFRGGDASAVLSRIGTQNLIQISEISANDVDTFIKAILDYVVDKSIATRKVEELQGKVDEDISADLYPFTNEAIEAMKGKLGGLMTPRNITQRMTDAAGKAFLMKRPIITSEITGG